MKKFDSCAIWLIRIFLSLFGRHKRDRVLASISTRLAPVITVDYPGKDIKILCNSKKSLYWAKNFYLHEPETIEWIRSFSSGDVFWDVGANVGIYSLFAAFNPGITVVAFEPMTESYSALQRNIWLNEKSDVIESFCLALSSSKSISRLSLNSRSSGSDSHTFIKGNDVSSGEKNIQTVLSLSVDEFIREYAPPFPNHLKIDVDGPELDVLQGAYTTLKDKRLQSILIEGDVKDTDRNRQLFSILEGSGLGFVLKGGTAGSDRHCNYLYRRRKNI